MLIKLAKKLFGSNRKEKSDSKKENESTNKLVNDDPLDPVFALKRARNSSLFDEQNPTRIKVTVDDFPRYEMLNLDDDTDTDSDGVPIPVPLNKAAMDRAIPSKNGVMDGVESLSGAFDGGLLGGQIANPAIMGWFAGQSFIGYQSCALIAQHWLVDKACTMAGDDACRNGWKLKTIDGDDIDTEKMKKLKALDIEYKVMENLSEFNRFKNIFGIRVAIFEVESDDPKYYEKPFNIDGVTPGSYKGISQVDPYWMMPVLSSESTSDPSNRHFYDPEFWTIGGRNYHRSHLIIARGPQPADILKPTYIFGGVPLTQRIYERVYAAERTANEAPLLSMSKRTTALHVDLTTLAANQDEFEKRIQRWIDFRDNHAVKILGLEETMDQFDVNLSDFDSVIMNQYQIVAAIAWTPATELLGTSPKGFNATGEFEMKSYNKHLTSIQTHVYTPFLDRHYLLLAKSNEMDIDIKISWNSTDTPTEKELADLNSSRSQTAKTYIEAGAVSPEEVRQALKDDDKSMFNRLSDEDANAEPGMSPEALAKLEAGEGRQAEGQAQLQRADEPASAKPAPKVNSEPPAAAAPNAAAAHKEGSAPGEDLESKISGIMTNPKIVKGLESLSSLLDKINDITLKEGHVPENISMNKTPGSVDRSVTPSVSGILDIVEKTETYKLPKIKMNGMVIAVENPKGSVRRGVTIDGNQWSVQMENHYGFIKGVIGADGDELDCFIGPDLKSKKVFIVNQNDVNTGEFDEHKCMLGFDDAESAKNGYMSSFSRDWNGFDSMHEMSMDDFKKWISNGNCSSPLNEACISEIQSSKVDQ